MGECAVRVAVGCKACRTKDVLRIDFGEIGQNVNAAEPSVAAAGV